MPTSLEEAASSLESPSQYHQTLNNTSACPSLTIQLSPSSSDSPCCSHYSGVSRTHAPLDKDQQFYFHDGNVFLVAGTTCFRVHQSILAKHSAVFRDMLNIPQPEAQETYEGVPMVELQDDPDNLRVLLKAIYEPFSSPLKTWLTRPMIQSQIEMVGVMSLALKYEVEALRGEIVHQLTSDWPRTIEDWDLLEKKLDMFGDQIPRPNSAVTVRMVRIADIPEFLPLAYYCAIQKYPQRPSDSEGSEDSTYDHCNENISFMPLLDRQDLSALALGRESMAIWVSQHARSNFRTWNCHSSTNQRGFVCDQRIHLRWAELLEDVTMRRDVLEIFKEHINWGLGTFGGSLCSPCQSAYIETMRQMRKDFFRDLPKMFGLGQLPR